MDAARDAPYRRGLACLLLGIAIELGGIVLELDLLVRTVEGSSLGPSVVAFGMMALGLLFARYGAVALWG